MNVQTVSIVYFAIFLLILIVVAIWAARQNKKGKSGAATEHFLGGKTTPMFVLALSYCASAVSAGSFVGDPAMTSVVGWPYYWLVMFLVPGLVIPGFFIIRKLRLQSEKYGSLTVNEYFGQRFKSPFLRLFIAVIMVFCLSMLLVSQFKASAILLEMFTGLPFKAGLLVIAVVVLFYTNAGGLRSVAWTDMIQGILMVVLCIILISVGLSAAGGLTNIEAELSVSHPEMLQIVQTGEGADMPLLGIVGMFLFTFCSMFSLPYLSSRYLALKDVSKKSVGKFLLISLFTGVLFNLMNLLGLAGRVLYPDAEADYLTITLAKDLLTPLISGLCMVGFFAAIISTATSILLVIGQCMGRDIWGHFDRKPGAEKRQVRVSQITNVVVMLVVIIFNFWKTPAMLQMFILMGMTGVGSACCAPLFCGTMWKKATKEGAIAAAIVGPFSYLFMNLGIIDIGWAWAMGLCVILAFAAMFILSWVLNKIRGVDEEMVKHATVTLDDVERARKLPDS